MRGKRHQHFPLADRGPEFRQVPQAVQQPRFQPGNQLDHQPVQQRKLGQQPDRPAQRRVQRLRITLQLLRQLLQQRALPAPAAQHQRIAPGTQQALAHLVAAAADLQDA